MDLSVSVYLSNQQIQIAVGNRGKKAGLTNVYTALAPEGTIINGIVMNTKNFVEFLKDFWNKNNIPKKDVYLVINSNKIAGKQIDLPKMNTDKAINFIQREFADMGRDEESEQVYGYTSLGVNAKEKMEKVYAESTPAELLHDYEQIFKELEIELKGIFSGEGSIIGIAKETALKQAKTFILQLANDNLLANVIFVEGEFYYYNSVRCFNAPGTQEHLEECAKSLSQISQFLQTRGLKGQFEKVLLAGGEPSQIAAYEDLIKSQGINTPAEAFQPGIGKGIRDKEAANFLFPIAGLYDFGKESNLLLRMNTKKKDDAKVNKFKARAMICIAVFVLMLISVAICWTLRFISKAQLDELKDYNRKVEMDVIRYDELSAENDSLEEEFNSMDIITQKIDSYPIATEEVIQVIKDAAKGYAEITIGDFDAEQGVLTVTAKAADVDLINQYIKILNKKDVFNSVNYTGYSYDSASNLWDIHVSCTLAESAGRHIEKSTPLDAPAGEVLPDGESSYGEE